MNELQEFLSLLEAEDKPKAVRYALHLLESGQMDVRTLYEQVLHPARTGMECRLSDRDICAWKEHVRKGIIRTIVECCYPYVLRAREAAGLIPFGQAVVLCPPEEYEDLEARMTADYFNLLGWNAVFVGNDTPFNDFLNAAKQIKPNVIVIMITNYYTLVASQKIIRQLKEQLGDSVIIAAGGYAVRGDSRNFISLGADMLAGSFEDIRRITEKAGVQT